MREGVQTVILIKHLEFEWERDAEWEGQRESERRDREIGGSERAVGERERERAEGENGGAETWSWWIVISTSQQNAGGLHHWRGLIAAVIPCVSALSLIMGVRYGGYRSSD